MTRIAFLSDIHFGRDGRCKEFSIPNTEASSCLPSEPELLESAIEVLKKMEPEYLFIAGDMTSVGSPIEFHYCVAIIKRIISEVGINENKVFWCAGNHDNNWNIAQLGDNSEFEQDKAGYDRVAASVADTNMTLKNNFTEIGPLSSSGYYEDDKLRLFVLNSSSKCVRKSVVEHGTLTKEQLDWLTDKLDGNKSDKWNIIMTHHHPFNYPYPTLGLDTSQIAEGSELCDIAGKNGVNLVIHGHRHHPKCKTQLESEWAAPVTFICGGSFSVNEKCRKQGGIPNIFHIIELTDEIGCMILYTYEYGASGWKEIKENRDEVPLDHKMYFGKVFSDLDTIEHVRRVIESKSDESQPIFIRWSELGDEVKYRSSERIKELLSNEELLPEYEIKITPSDYILAVKKVSE